MFQRSKGVKDVKTIRVLYRSLTPEELGELKKRSEQFNRGEECPILQQEVGEPRQIGCPETGEILVEYFSNISSSFISVYTQSRWNCFADTNQFARPFLIFVVQYHGIVVDYFLHLVKFVVGFLSMNLQLEGNEFYHAELIV